MGFGIQPIYSIDGILEFIHGEKFIIHKLKSRLEKAIGSKSSPTSILCTDAWRAFKTYCFIIIKLFNFLGSLT